MPHVYFEISKLYHSLRLTGEGNGNPLQYSCLENLRDGGAWWAAVYGIAQSRTRLKRLSSSSSSKQASSCLHESAGLELLQFPLFLKASFEPISLL